MKVFIVTSGYHDHVKAAFTTEESAKAFIADKVANKEISLWTYWVSDPVELDPVPVATLLEQ